MQSAGARSRPGARYASGSCVICAHLVSPHGGVEVDVMPLTARCESVRRPRRSGAGLTAGAASRVDEDCFDLGVDGSELVRCPGFVDVVEFVRDAQQELFSLACH